MNVQINTDHNIKGTEKLQAFVSDKINTTLKHFTDRITRIEVHLSDENATKGGPDDIQCKIEARLKGLQPMVVTSKNSSKEKALSMAVDKMKGALDSAIGKLKAH
ncbi:HPF/RaiA family ribosome-associated protein [Fulvivirga lutea]|uniref:HPF/RaiA family ribosome-associated protein n=1 Tax=Fulvivirga lutea TaxID=2810512 RepID=A0A975A0G1_9BACT|nr:HPF/RaiA family ribosome-associated protein [Fulvivirga lutea]QSE97359.1 HPF/RaiA family ribosome-associated protein [Fulvivirga lutea]